MMTIIITEKKNLPELPTFQVESDVSVRFSHLVFRRDLVVSAVGRRDARNVQCEDVVGAIGDRFDGVAAAVLDHLGTVVPDDGGRGVGHQAHLELHAPRHLADRRLGRELGRTALRLCSCKGDRRWINDVQIGEQY